MIRSLMLFCATSLLITGSGCKTIEETPLVSHGAESGPATVSMFIHAPTKDGKAFSVGITCRAQVERSVIRGEIMDFIKETLGKESIKHTESELLDKLLQKTICNTTRQATGRTFQAKGIEILELILTPVPLDSM